MTTRIVDADGYATAIRSPDGVTLRSQYAAKFLDGLRVIASNQLISVALDPKPMYPCLYVFHPGVGWMQQEKIDYVDEDQIHQTAAAAINLLIENEFLPPLEGLRLDREEWGMQDVLVYVYSSIYQHSQGQSNHNYLYDVYEKVGIAIPVEA